MKTKTFFTVAAVFMAALVIITVFSSCFSDWRGDEATITLNLGGGANNRVVGGEFIVSNEGGESGGGGNGRISTERMRGVLEHKVLLSGPAGVQTFEFAKGVQTPQITVAPGRYDITVEAYIGLVDWYLLSLSLEAEGGDDWEKTQETIQNLSFTRILDDIRREGNNEGLLSIFEANGWKLPAAYGSSPFPVDVIAGKNTPVTITMEWVDDPGGGSETETEVFDYVLNYPDSSCNIVGFREDTQISGEVVIPAMHFENDKIWWVIGISEYAFRDNTDITSVFFDQNSRLETISDGAFYGCSGLTKVIIPSTVTSIGDKAFAGTSLEIVVFEGYSAIFDPDAFPQENSGNNLWEVYSATGGGLGTYIKTTTGDNTVWVKTLRELSGNITINAISDGTYTQLTANYNGPEIVTYQWFQNGTALGDPSWSNQHTTSVPDSYTVTVSAPGYHPKTSDPVIVSGGGGGTPTVTSVTVSPELVSVERGDSYTFSALVTTTNGADETVTWTIANRMSAGTTISEDGILTVATDETAITLTVTATSAVNTSVFGTATVTVTAVPTTVESVELNLSYLSITWAGQATDQSSIQQFYATVHGTGDPPQTVTWALSGSSYATLTQEGLLTVPYKCPVATLTITATSTANPSKSGTATVSIKEN